MAMALEQLHGRVLDLDSHERVPIPRWGDVWGDRGRRYGELFEHREDKTRGQARGEEHEPQPDDPGMYLGFDSSDTMEITPQTVFAKKGTVAPAAINLNRRPEVLDMMGTKRALLFPGMGLIALADGMASGMSDVPLTDDEKRIAWAAVDAHNEWAGEFTGKYNDRLRVVGILGRAHRDQTVASLVDETERLLALGVRAILVTVDVPMAGLSPADPAMDPFYGTLAHANVPLITHPPSGLNFTQEEWHHLGGLAAGGASTFHLASENFIRIATLGGVFERHPTLRVGAIEQGSWWFGPLAELMDLAASGNLPSGFAAQMDEKLSMLPSEYLNRNVRVTPWNFEPVNVWFERYPKIQNCYCFSTDYPHVEGREWALQTYYEALAPYGDDIMERFFCTNGQLILPETTV